MRQTEKEEKRETGREREGRKGERGGRVGNRGGREREGDRRRERGGREREADKRTERERGITELGEKLVQAPTQIVFRSKIIVLLDVP